jgi:lipoprotein signal peptidase
MNGTFTVINQNTKNEMKACDFLILYWIIIQVIILIKFVKLWCQTYFQDPELHKTLSMEHSHKTITLLMYLAE